jgi:Tol biopolymer transport system component
MVATRWIARHGALGLLAAGLLFAAAGLGAPAPVGSFADQADVGGPALAGSAQYDPAGQSYRVTGGGQNMWARTDAFHFVWQRASGDVSLAADVRWVGEGKEAHRKACLLIRQSLDADSAYADAALHGDGLTSLQYRETAGGLTYEIQSDVSRPSRIGIEKQSDRFFMLVGRPGQPLRRAGGSIKLALKEPFYVGLAVCSHDDAVLETAEFRDVRLSNDKYRPAAEPAVESTLEVVDVASKNRRVLYHTAGLIEAPNWTPDGRSLLFNAKGQIYRLPSKGGEPERVDTGAANRCNNDHGLSPDGKLLAVSSQHAPDRKSRIYVLPAAGGEPKEITASGPSYWHGWSPDGRTLVYCAERDGEFDVYAVPAEGGPEKRLTTAPGLDDGPEYSPDGKFIYFNSERTGRMQIWRMRPDGSGQEQVTSDDFNNWFPHPSPDGRWLVFLSYAPDVKGHPANKDVRLRLMPSAGGPVQELAQVFGGQGTINVPSWAPDSRRLAFVSYQLVAP